MRRSGKRLRDETHLRWVRSLPCCVCKRRPCGVAHHRTGAGMGLKADDSQTIPLCDACHKDLHEYRGHFRGMNRVTRAEWQDRMITETLALVS